MRIAIVDDEEIVRNQIRNYVEQFCQARELPVACACFEDADSFLKNYSPVYDAVFLDIKMPGSNGMEAARILRRTDQATILVFITNLKQYAIQGYTVDAIGFVVKPVNRYDFDVVMEKVIRRVRSNGPGDLSVKTANGMARLRIRDILYIEVIRHKLVFHTVGGEVES
ncbi:MAG: response regulator transcription factor, partial [Lachnospiraceae bacterium]|nr:response regulator transcription factor [Lachnospiraceae bacterium]